MIPFSSVRRAWSPSGVRLRGSPRAPAVAFFQPSVVASLRDDYVSTENVACARISAKLSQVPHMTREVFSKCISLAIYTRE